METDLLLRPAQRIRIEVYPIFICILHPSLFDSRRLALEDALVPLLKPAHGFAVYALQREEKAISVCPQRSAVW